MNSYLYRGVPVVACVMLLLLLGCQPSGNSAGEAALSSGERATWEKYRRSDAVRPDYRIAAYQVRQKDWSLAATEGGWKSRLEGAGLNDLEAAQAAAKRVAGRPNIKAAVLLEMLEAKDPEIVEWCVDDGRGAQASESAPSPELERSLKEFILQLQRSVTP